MLFMSRLSGPHFCGGWIGCSYQPLAHPARERADNSGETAQVKRGGVA